MKTNVILTVFVSAIAFLSSCVKDEIHVTPTGNVTSINLQVSNISELEVEDLFEVFVTFSESEESAVIEANQNLHQVIEAEQRGNSLIIGLDDDVQISGSPVLKLHLTTSSLDKVKATGASSVKFENTLAVNSFEAEISGASKLTGNIEVGDLDATLYGASMLDLAGSSNSLTIDAEGASDMTGFSFSTNFLDADLNGSSDVSVTINQELSVDARGASKVYFKGNGVITHQNLSDASQIVKVD